MRRRAFTVALTLALALASVALVFAPGPERIASPMMGERVPAKVLAVDSSNVRLLGEVRYGTETLDVEIAEGSFAGTRAKAANIIRAQLELDRFYSPGDVATVTIPPGWTADGGAVLTAGNKWHTPAYCWLFGAFALFLVAFGGWTGAKALLSFALSCLAIWKGLVPMVLAGVSASLAAFLWTAFLTGAIMFLVGGVTKKAFAAFGGAMLGVAAALGLAKLTGFLLDVNGATLPFVQTLLYSGFAHLDLADVFTGAAILAASGAMMDLAMDIAAGMREIVRHNPAVSRRELLLSGLRIGRATVGTMTTTLLLAYSGGYLTLLMVFAAQGTEVLDFINSPLVAAEAAKTFVGSFAILLVAPFTAFVAAMLFASARKT